MRARSTKSAALISLWLAFGVPGCSGEQPDNLLFIVVDTLRADHLGAYGADRDTSPNIDGLAAGGVRFERAYATAPWTQPSVASMLTGLHPKTHGADRLMRKLPGSAHTLAERLADEGFATGCVVSHWLIGPRFGFDQGCADMIHGNAVGKGRLSTPGVTRRAHQLLERYASEQRPFFLFVHYFDPHYRYERHSRIGFAAERAGRLDGHESIPELRALEPIPDEAERSLLRDLYDEEIAFTDAGIGRLLKSLEKRGLSQRTWIVLVADHGEEFFERGWLGHTRTLHEELLRVPLVIRPPQATTAARVVETPVSLVGLMPTLLDLLGIAPSSDPEAPALQGASFAALVRDTAGFTPATVYGDTEYWRSEHAGAAPGPAALERKHAVVRGRYKLVEDRNSGRRALYDLALDPDERTDTSEANPELTAELAEELRHLSSEAESARLPDAAPIAEAAPEPTPAETSMLKQLGYIEE